MKISEKALLFTILTIIVLVISSTGYILALLYDGNLKNTLPHMYIALVLTGLFFLRYVFAKYKRSGYQFCDMGKVVRFLDILLFLLILPILVNLSSIALSSLGFSQLGELAYDTRYYSPLLALVCYLVFQAVKTISLRIIV